MINTKSILKSVVFNDDMNLINWVDNIRDNKIIYWTNMQLNLCISCLYIYKIFKHQDFYHKSTTFHISLLISTIYTNNFSLPSLSWKSWSSSNSLESFGVNTLGNSSSIEIWFLKIIVWNWLDIIYYLSYFSNI